MNLRARHAIKTVGDGPKTILFAHGFGCNQNMWRRIVPAFAEDYTCVLFDHVGSGKSDPSAYDKNKYADLAGYADDLIEIVEAFAVGPCIVIGHSVSSMIAMIAAIRAPYLFAALGMYGPSPCYMNDGAYPGGFSRGDIDELLLTLEGNYLGWAGSMAPSLMGAPDQPELAIELVDSFSRTEPDMAKDFARVTFLSDYRRQLPLLTTPTLIVQSSDDLLVPVAVGQYMHRAIEGSTLSIVENVGHYPHLSVPDASIEATKSFFKKHGL